MVLTKPIIGVIIRTINHQSPSSYIEEKYMGATVYSDDLWQICANPNIYAAQNAYKELRRIFGTPEVEKPPKERNRNTPTIGNYILWQFVSVIPLIGWIIAIVWAVDSSWPARATYFRSFFVILLVAVLLSLVSGGLSAMMIGSFFPFALF